MKKHIFKLFLLVGLCLGINYNLMAQVPADFSTVKVDEWSDAQVRALIKQVESLGYTDAQLEQLALQRGMAQAEILKLRKRVEAIRKQDGTKNKNLNNKPAQTDNSDRRFDSDNPDSLNRNQLSKRDLLDKAFDDLKPKIFGDDLFKNNAITFEPNLRIATPRNYVIGPDDVLLIDLSGVSDVSYQPRVSPDGTIRIEYISPIAVSGLSVEAATAKIKAALSVTYASVRSGGTIVSVNLGNIRSIKVTLTGNVTKPATYTISSLSTVFNALYYSGGPNQNGSFRKIQVIRNGTIISTVDAYPYIISGVQKGNIRLQDQDVINIPAYETRVEVVGEVKTPAIFEAKAGETFQDILNFASGFSTSAYRSRVKVFQNTEKERRITDIFAADFKTYRPQNGDKFFVEPILDRFENRVEIEGAVFRPGPYALEKGLTLKGLIQKAEGVTEEAFMSRGNIVRLNADNSLALISFDLGKVMAGTANDIVLQREDKITISSIFDLRDEYKINIAGEVRQPGEFDFASGMTLEDLIQRAGGFTEGATPNRIDISRRIRNSDATSASAITAQVLTVNVDQNLRIMGESFVLQPFDIVTIRSSETYSIQKQVFVEGEVLFPGPYTILNKNEKISDLIRRAGGLTPFAYTDGASLKRPGPPKAIEKNDRNAIDLEADKERDRQLTVRRLGGFSEKDAAIIEKDSVVLVSDLVGINLVNILASPGNKEDLILEEGDVIRVPKELQTVKVSGEVLNPNNIVYRPGRGFKQYVLGAGGFSTKALRKGSYIKYANGSVEAASSFLFFRSYPRVKPGAEILVPERPKREPLNAQALIGIGTAVASLAAIIVSLLK